MKISTKKQKIRQNHAIQQVSHCPPVCVSCCESGPQHHVYLCPTGQGSVCDKILFSQRIEVSDVNLIAWFSECFPHSCNRHQVCRSFHSCPLLLSLSPHSRPVTSSPTKINTSHQHSSHMNVWPTSLLLNSVWHKTYELRKNEGQKSDRNVTHMWQEPYEYQTVSQSHLWWQTLHHCFWN